jgi:hypothetical protein
MPLSTQMEKITPKVRPDNLLSTLDINGNEIVVGATVRAFDFPFEMDDGTLTGFGLNEERTCFATGVVTAIGDVRIEGCPRYTVELVSRTRARRDEIITEAAEPGDFIYPPVNGLRILGGTRRTCGVVVFEG